MTIATVVVGSLNPVKIQATASAINKLSIQANALGAEVSSGIPNQPVGAEETLRGSVNRARAAASLDYADYGVGLEGGLMSVGLEWFCIGFATVATRSGLIRSAMAPGVWVPPPVIELVRQGMELGDAEDLYYKVENSKQRGGLVGNLTSGLILREETFVIPTLTAFCLLDYEAER